MSANTKTTLPPPPLTLHYLGKPIRLTLHHTPPLLAIADLAAAIGPRCTEQLRQQLQTHAHQPDEHTPPSWPLPALLQALRRSRKPAARQLRRWLSRELLPALHQLPPAAPRWEQALSLAAEAGQQISHAVLQTVLQQEENWQHTHWLLTLDYTPDHPRRHSHGRLSALECSATPLQALADEIAQPKGLGMQNGDLLKLVAACHAQLAQRMNKQAWREMARRSDGD